jgi:Ca-activated chloride channel homolog
VGAVASGATGASGQRVEVPYLRPPTRSTHDISLSVEIDAGVPIERLESPSHVVSVERTGKSTARVRLSASDSVPNKDFVLRAHVAGDSVRTALLTHDEGTGGYFTMLLVPPADVHRVARGPLEVVFVLDASGSMQGGPISQAKAAAARGLQRLRETDTFQVINFANSASALGAYPIEATPANVARGVQHLEEVQAAGGTEMIHGIRGALAFPHDPTRLRYVVFLTDGFIGNETDILRETHARLGASRVFSFGVGSSTNRYLMDSMARMGQGAAAYLGHQDSPREVMDLFFDRVERAALTDIRLDFGRATVRDVYPSRLPDVFVGRPVVIVGRYEGDAPRSVSVTGRVGGREVTFRGESRAARGGSAPAPLPRLWARARITELAERSAWDPDTALPAQVRDVALTHGLMSPYTAFIAVDSSVRTQGAYGTTVPVPVPVPQGVRYETTVGP